MRKLKNYYTVHSNQELQRPKLKEKTAVLQTERGKKAIVIYILNYDSLR